MTYEVMMIKNSLKFFEKLHLKETAAQFVQEEQINKNKTDKLFGIRKEKETYELKLVA